MADQRVVVVTGASRGAGRGIAVALAPNSVVYVTGRTTTNTDAPANLEHTADQIREAGGEAVVLPTDHSDDAQTAAVFERVRTDHGRLDICVANATMLAPPPGPKPFWERELDVELNPLRVGARSHYVTLHHAAQLMVPHGNGLFVATSSPGAAARIPGLHGVTYGMGKAATDKMIHEAGEDLRPTGIVAISLWMGVVLTEQMLQMRTTFPDFFDDFAPGYETPEFNGRVIDAVWRDPDAMSRTGRAWYSAELASEYGVTEDDGTTPVSTRDWMGGPLNLRSVAPSWKAHQDQQSG